MVERGSSDETPHEDEPQTMELEPRADNAEPCDCDILPDETAQNK